MSTDEALTTATTNAASLLDGPKLGSLRPGAVGDVVVVEGNVLTDISLLARPSGIRHVVRAGRDLSGYLREVSEALDLQEAEHLTRSEGS